MDEVGSNEEDTSFTPEASTTSVPQLMDRHRKTRTFVRFAVAPYRAVLWYWGSFVILDV